MPVSEIARIAQVDLSTARRWKRGAICPPFAARVLLEGDLGGLDPAWRGWVLRRGELVSPENWRATPGDVLEMQLMRARIATLQSENRLLRGLAEDFDEDQPQPSAWPAIRA